MISGLFIFATLCTAAAFLFWLTTPDASVPACEERDAYNASLATGAIAFGIILAIGFIGLGLVSLGWRWLHSAVRP
jgi:hypothetical protein